jgi:hypothetical protein
MSDTASTNMPSVPTSAALQEFRDGFYGCLNGWGDALFELTDATLCTPAPVTSVPTLSLEPVFRRSHGSLYKCLDRGAIDTEALRALLVANRPAQWPLVFAVDASTWARCDAETSPQRGFYYSASKHSAGAADRCRLVLPMDHPARLGNGLLDRTGGRGTYRAAGQREHRHDRPGPPADRPAARRHGRADVRLRRRLRPDRAHPRPGRYPRADRGPHPIRPGLLPRTATTATRHPRTAPPSRRPFRLRPARHLGRPPGPADRGRHRDPRPGCSTCPNRPPAR